MNFAAIFLIFGMLYSGFSISGDQESKKIDELGYLLAKSSIQYQVDQKITLFKQYKKVQRGTKELEEMKEILCPFELKDIVQKRLDTGNNKDLLETIKKEELNLKLECLKDFEWGDICKDYVCKESLKRWLEYLCFRGLILTPAFVLNLALAEEYFFGHIYDKKPFPTGLTLILNTVSIFGVCIYNRFLKPYFTNKEIIELSENKDFFEKSKSKAIEYMQALLEPLKENNCNSFYLGQLTEFFSLSKQKLCDEKTKLFKELNDNL